MGFVSGKARTREGLSLHYRDYAGPPGAPFTIICIPGLTRNARDFEDLAAVLETRWRVVCLDLRGRGGSDYAPDPLTYIPGSYVRDLGALYDHLGLDEAVLIGTSLGGLVSTLFAAIYPQKVLGVVLNDVGPEIDPAGLARIASYVGKTRPINSWQDAADAIEMLDRVVYPDYGPADWMRTARQRYVEEPDGRVHLDYDLNIAKAFVLPATTPQQWPFFRRLQGLPLLLVRGATSDILARATADQMKVVAPGMAMVEIPARGHTPTLTEPQALAAIEAFLTGLPAGLDAWTRVSRTLAGWSFHGEARRLGVL